MYLNETVMENLDIERLHRDCLKWCENPTWKPWQDQYEIKINGSETEIADILGSCLATVDQTYRPEHNRYICEFAHLIGIDVESYRKAEPETPPRVKQSLEVAALAKRLWLGDTMEKEIDAHDLRTLRLECLKLAVSKDPNRHHQDIKNEAQAYMDWVMQAEAPAPIAVNLSAEMDGVSMVGLFERVATQSREAKPAEAAKEPKPEDHIAFLKSVITYPEMSDFHEEKGRVYFTWCEERYRFNPTSREVSLMHSRGGISGSPASILMTALVKMAAGKMEPDPNVYVKIEDVKAMFGKLNGGSNVLGEAVPRPEQRQYFKHAKALTDAGWTERKESEGRGFVFSNPNHPFIEIWHDGKVWAFEYDSFDEYVIWDGKREFMGWVKSEIQTTHH